MEMALETEAPRMIMHIVSQPDIELLILQKDALSHQLQTAYQHYYAALAAQENGDPAIIDDLEVRPLEAEFQRVYASIVAYMRQADTRWEGDVQ